MSKKAHTFVLSDESINAYGYKLKTEGIDTSVFDTNPVMLLEHDSDKLIGRWNNLRIEGSRLLADPDFDADDELAVRTSKKVENGFLRGASAGFMILEVGEERTAEGALVPVVLKSKLLEASLVALPGNSNALRLYNTQGQLLSQKEAQLSIKEMLSAKTETTPEKSYNVKLTADNLKALGLPEDCKDEGLINERINKLNTDLNQFKTSQAEKLKKDVEEFVDANIKSGRLKAGKRDTLVELGVKDFEGLKAIVEDTPEPKKPNEMLSGGGKGSPEGREDWNFNDWRRKDPVGLLKMKQEQPDEYKELLRANENIRHI